MTTIRTYVIRIKRSFLVNIGVSFRHRTTYEAISSRILPGSKPACSGNLLSRHNIDSKTFSQNVKRAGRQYLFDHARSFPAFIGPMRKHFQRRAVASLHQPIEAQRFALAYSTGGSL